MHGMMQPLAVAAGMGRLEMVRWLASQGASLILPVVAAAPTKKNTAKPSVRTCSHSSDLMLDNENKYNPIRIADPIIIFLFYVSIKFARRIHP